MSKIDEITELLKGADNGSGAKREPHGDYPGTAESDTAEGAARATGEAGTYPEPDGSTGEGEGGDTGESQAPLTLKALAEKAGTDAKALYDGLQIPLGDGDEAMTIGQLKDQVVEYRKTRTAIDDQLTELMAKRVEVENLHDYIPDEALAEFRASNEAKVQREIEALKKAIPSWNNPETVNAERAKIYKLAAKYGLSAQDMEQMVTDHRMVKLMRDMALSQDAGARTPKPSPRHTPERSDAYKRGTAPGATKQDKLSAINALLTN